MFVKRGIVILYTYAVSACAQSQRYSFARSNITLEKHKQELIRTVLTVKLDLSALFGHSVIWFSTVSPVCTARQTTRVVLRYTFEQLLTRATTC